MKLVITNTAGKPVSLPGILGGLTPSGSGSATASLPAGATITANIFDYQMEAVRNELMTLVNKGYVSYITALDPTVPDNLETVATNLINVATVTFTNAQCKALKATPQVVVPAQGKGTVIVPVECSIYLKYGTNAFTANAGENFALKRVGGSALFSGGVQAFLQATASGVNKMFPAVVATPSQYDSKTLSDNIALQFVNIGAVELAGNAANDNTLTVQVSYRVDTMVW